MGEGPAGAEGTHRVDAGDDSAATLAEALERWLGLARKMLAELSRAEPDLEQVQGLLAERDEVQKRVAALLAGGPPGEALRSDRVRTLVQAILECDRGTVERAEALRDDARARLRAAGKGREVGEAYHRALVRAARHSGVFVDRKG